MSDNQEKWTDKIAKMMALAENPATSLDQREEIMNKVLALMAKYSIEEAMLNSKANKNEEAIRKDYVIGKDRKVARQQMLTAIAKAFGGRCVFMRNSDKVAVYAFTSDHEKIFLLYSSLCMQMNFGLATASVHKPSHVHGKTFNASWVLGFSNTVAKRVRDAYKKSEDDIRKTSTGMDLVLVNRSTLVNQRLMVDFPKLGTFRLGGNVRSGDGYSAGSSAGRNADIGQSRVGGGSRAIGS